VEHSRLLAGKNADHEQNPTIYLWLYIYRHVIIVSLGKLHQIVCSIRIYNGNRLEVVNDFNNLATVFNYTGIFPLNQQQLVGKGLKALNVLLIKCRWYKLKRNLNYFVNCLILL